jgi:hypothetical protein
MRLCRVRYSYLAAQIAAKPTLRPSPEGRYTGELKERWLEFERARRALTRAQKQYALARKRLQDAERAHLLRIAEHFREEEPSRKKGLNHIFPELPKIKPLRDKAAASPTSQAERSRGGRPANLPLRLALRALLRLFREAFGEEPTRTRGGPAVRFVTAFFSGTDGEWWWTDVYEWVGEGQRMITSYPVPSVPAVPPSKAADAIKLALQAETRGEFAGGFENGGDWCSGFFDRGKTEKKLAGPPQLFRLAEPAGGQ